MSFHPEIEKLPDVSKARVINTDSLICPRISNHEHLINCLGKNCALFENCYSENLYKMNYVKFFVWMMITFLSAVIVILLVK